MVTWFWGKDWAGGGGGRAEGRFIVRYPGETGGDVGAAV